MPAWFDRGPVPGNATTQLANLKSANQGHPARGDGPAEDHGRDDRRDRHTDERTARHAHGQGAREQSDQGPEGETGEDL